MANAKKPKGVKARHTWKVVRTNNQSADVIADNLTVVDGDLVFSTDSVTVRVIAANTYTDVELLGPETGRAVASAIFQHRTTGRAR